MKLRLSVKFLSKCRTHDRNIEKLQTWGYDTDLVMKKIGKGIENGDDIPPPVLLITPTGSILEDGNHRVTVYKNKGIKKILTKIKFRLR